MADGSAFHPQASPYAASASPGHRVSGAAGGAVAPPRSDGDGGVKVQSELSKKVECLICTQGRFGAAFPQRVAILWHNRYLTSAWSSSGPEKTT